MGRCGDLPAEGGAPAIVAPARGKAFPQQAHRDRNRLVPTITDQIIAMLDRVTTEFRLPWYSPARNMMRPVNIASNKAYRGVNILALWATAHEKGYSSGTWGTYRQWAEAGAQVRKGEKSAYIVFYKELTVASEDGDGDETDTRHFARAMPVFAAEQVDGWTAPKVDAPPPPIMTPIEQAEAFVAATGVSVTHGGDRAFYRPSTDSIQLPPREAFIGSPTSTPAEAYYSTALHELTHWTSHESRCNRQLGKRFGDDAYAMEELVAELGAAFLCADLGITAEPRVDHAQYLNHWLTVMKADKKAIFTAASKASDATAFLAALQTAKPYLFANLQREISPQF
jgi:antirestriction protein ArdC